MPTFSIPSEIFEHLRRDLRAQFGIPSYDPNDPSDPDLQPYDSYIAGVDPSPPKLRCKSCKGRLLRGVNSAFCVFCGEERLLDAMFREIAVPISGEDRPYRYKNKVKGEICLSDLLSLEIKWSVQEEEATTGSKYESDGPKSSLNLGGLDLDNFFCEGNKEQGDDHESRVSESNIVPAPPDSLSLFGNVSPSSTANNLTEYEKGNYMSDWEAEFRLAGSETPRESDQIRTLRSQMHNISFMLDSNLSSPKDSGKPQALEK